MIGQPPRYTLATPVFRFRSLAALSGRAALGGDRETLLACLQLGRLCAGIVPPYELTRDVTLERTEIACDTIVLALGPWSAEAASWLDLPIEVRPLKGQILRLQAPGPPVPCSVGWGHNYATTKTDGLGMGLAIVRTIVRAHGGTVGAENNPQGGASLHVTLPVDPEGAR